MKKFIHYLLILLNTAALAQADRVQKNIASKQINTVQPFREPKKFIGIDLGYGFSLPQGKMAHGINGIHNITAEATLPLNFISRNLFLQPNIAYGVYGFKEFGINYIHAGNYINTTINFNSSAYRGGLQLLYVWNRHKVLQPFAGLQAGYIEFASSFQVNDPLDPMACRALESDVFMADGTVYTGYLAGVNIRVSKTEPHFIKFQVSQINGRAVNYVNANNITHQHQPPANNNNAENKPVFISFINPANNNIHQHQIGELFNHKVNLLEFKLSYLFYLRTSRKQ